MPRGVLGLRRCNSTTAARGLGRGAMRNSNMSLLYAEAGWAAGAVQSGAVGAEAAMATHMGSSTAASLLGTFTTMLASTGRVVAIVAAAAVVALEVVQDVATTVAGIACTVASSAAGTSWNKHGDMAGGAAVPACTRGGVVTGVCELNGASSTSTSPRGGDGVNASEQGNSALGLRAAARRSWSR